MSNKLRWGILGTGNIARQFAAGLKASQRGIAHAVGSRSGQSAEHFGELLGIPIRHGSYQQLIDDGEIDVVYNALPNHLHARWTIAALGAGKHVLCEKPLGMNADEARRMFQAADAAGRMLMEAFMYRSHPQTHAVAEALRGGAIGNLRLIRTSFCFRTRKVEGNVRFSGEMGGGSLMDIGCYCINFSRFFAGAEPSAVHAVAKIHANGIDDAAAAALAFPGGILASFTCGLSVQADNSAYLLGDEGYIEIPVPWKPPRQSQFIITRGQAPRMDNASPVSPPPRDVRTVLCESDLYALEADDFAATLLDIHPPTISRQDSIGNMMVLDEMRKQIGLKF